MQVLVLFCLFFFIQSGTSKESDSLQPQWLVNFPQSFRRQSRSFGKLIDVTKNPTAIQKYEVYVENTLKKLDEWTDGENVDALEHFFWGMANGVALELGGLDGSPFTRSMTYDYEKLFGWKRIVIDGNPQYREPLKMNSPEAFGVIAAICNTQSSVHYVKREYVGGILEFMSKSFIEKFHKDIFESTIPHGNISAVDWTKFSQIVEPVECMPLSIILHKAHVSHINLFILDAEGGELDVLKSIHWDKIRFDVICVETNIAHRPIGYQTAVTEYLSTRGYIASTKQLGRNTWYIRSDFVPHVRPGIHLDCFKGMERSSNNYDACLI